jgi:dihydropyrimidinase
LQSDDADIFEALETLRDLGGILCVHAESGRVLDLLVRRHHNAAEMRRHGAYLHALTRPNFIEAEAIERAIHWGRATGGPLFIVHVSTAEGADLVKRAQAEGVNVLAETCAHYLVLDDSVLAGKDGHLYATSPQVKKPRDQRRLWRGLRGGEICSVSTDTCTFTRKQKAAWKGDWTKIPMGLPGLETLLPIVYTHGVLRRRLTISQFVDKCCTRPARVMGLYPRKGTLRVGSDADVVVFHPTHKRKVDWRKMQTNCDWNPYQGWDLAGFAEHTFCRGRQVVEDYKFVGSNGYGQFVPRGRPRR